MLLLDRPSRLRHSPPRSSARTRSTFSPPGSKAATGTCALRLCQTLHALSSVLFGARATDGARKESLQVVAQVAGRSQEWRLAVLVSAISRQRMQVAYCGIKDPAALRIQ